MSAARPLSGVERLWLVADRLAPPFVNQLVLEGEGRLGIGAVQGAVEACARVRPALRLLRRGSRWVADGPTPAVRQGDAEWDGLGPAGAPDLTRPLDPDRGPTVEVLLLGSRVVIRTHHAAFDGQGTLLVARGLFAALRGEPVDPIPLHTTTDAELATGPPESLPSITCPPALGGAVEDEPGVRWVRRTARGSARQLVARLAFAIAQGTAEPHACRIDVPVDLRPAGLLAHGNLTGLVRLPVAAGLAPWHPRPGIDALDQELRRRLPSAGGFPAATAGLARIPLGLLVRGGRDKARQQAAAGRYGTTATVSNLGRLDLDAFSGGGFTAAAGFFIPPGNPGLPLFMAVAGGPSGIELCGSAPVALASGGRLELLMDRLVAAIEGPA